MNQTRNDQPIARKAPLSPEQARAEGGALLSAIENLAELLDIETGAVRSRKRTEIEALQNAKNEAVALYERHLYRLRQVTQTNRDDLNNDEAFKVRLLNASTRLDRSISANVVALQSARDANERLMSMIQNAVTAQHPTGAGYTARGANNAGYKHAGAPAMTLNGTF
jgi:hypothetical protein